MSDSRSRRDLVLVGLGVAAALVAVAAYQAVQRGALHEVGNRAAALFGHATTALPPLGKPVKLHVPKDKVLATVVVDVWEPQKLRDALAQNAWFHDVLQAPLGKGAVGSWAGFLASKGEDLGAGFKGAVLDFVASNLLAGSFRVAWFAATSAAAVPAVVVPTAGGAASAAFDALEHAADRGTFEAAACPGEAAGAAPIEIKRWLVADQPVFAARKGARMAFSRRPEGALDGLCAELPEAARTPGADVDATFDLRGLGHEAQLLAQLLGLGPTPRLALAVRGNALAPVGIVSDHGTSGHLAAAPLPEAMLKALPADSPVILAMQLVLPDALTPATLSAFLSGKGGAEKRSVRPAALLWTPRGDDRPPDFALVWPGEKDDAFLRKAFSGPNLLVFGAACGETIIGSDAAAVDRVRRVCTGAAPSVLSAAPAVVQGLEAPASLQIAVNLGVTLGNLTLDAFHAENGAKAPPAEIQAAVKQLQDLPFLGWRGVAKGDAVVPEGYRS
ncbi:MAG TPA: hypothetical protein VMB50_23310 [Myxococcales bacterium]|nr:hypothetical protein [Myxococcales bacterium]